MGFIWSKVGMAEHSRSTADDQRERSRALLAKLKSKRTFRGSTKFNDEEGKEKIGPSFSQIMEEKISSMLKEARDLHESGDFQRAVTKLTRAIVLEPRNPDLFKLRAEAYFSLSEYHSAIINFQKVISLQPSAEGEVIERLACVHYEYGASLYDNGQYARALEMFEKTSEYQPHNKEPVMRRIGCLLSLRRYDECLVMINEELELDDANPDLHVFRAKLNRLFGNNTQCYYDVCSALGIDPDHAEALKLKAELEEKAVDCKNQAVHNSLVGRKKDALRKISTAIDSDPAVAEYHILRGALYRRLGDFNAAVDDYLTAMDKCSHDQDCTVYQHASRHLILTYNDFAMECFRQRCFGEAVTLLNQAIKEEKGEKGLYLNRGDCFYRMDNLHFALADYQQALDLDPTNWDVSCRIAVVHCELGVDLFSKGSYEKAEKQFTAALQHNPKVSRFYLCRARARNELKNISGIKDDVIAALLLHPGCEECLSLIARVFPGKTAQELMRSHEASMVRGKLDAEMKRIAELYAPTSDNRPSNSGTIPPIASQYLEGIELKMAESAEQKSNSASRTSLSLTVPSLGPDTKLPFKSFGSSDKPQPESRATGTKSRKSSTDKKQATVMMEAKSGEEIEPKEEEEEEEGSSLVVSPRQWSVLECPLPPLTSDPHGVLPALTACLKEDNFHKQIYYSKKACTEEVQRVLRSPPEHYGIAERAPRIQLAHDIVFGGRTVATANSLLRNINK